MRPLVWFRSDLRTGDNAALASALTRAEGRVVAVFLISRTQWESHNWGAPKIDFVLRNVESLRRPLADLGVVLHTLEVPRFAEAPAALLNLAREQRCDTLLFNREYEFNERQRDEDVAAAFAEAGLRSESFDDQTVLPPAELRTGSGQFYRVFTPFRNAWLDAVKARLPIRLYRVKGSVQAGVEHPVGKSKWSATWPAGEREAHRRLKQFVQNDIKTYSTDRNFPALESTSTLSPYLAAGVISPKQCVLAAMEANDGGLDTGDENITTWIGELIWREFYRHVMVGFPRICKYQPFRLDTNRIPWRQDDDGFAAWCEGRTGVPIVDAGMRQLRETAWMHNRLRMITAMFLTKSLLIDWRLGERFFSRSLIDVDLANNNGGWQWCASTGTDAAPYFRMFNPESQSRKFDPTGEYIRRWVRELNDLNGNDIHESFSSSPLLGSARGYPAPIVDHAEARRRVMAVFSGD